MLRPRCSTWIGPNGADMATARGHRGVTSMDRQQEPKSNSSPSNLPFAICNELNFLFSSPLLSPPLSSTLTFTISLKLPFIKDGDQGGQWSGLGWGPRVAEPVTSGCHLGNMIRRLQKQRLIQQ